MKVFPKTIDGSAQPDYEKRILISMTASSHGMLAPKTMVILSLLIVDGSAHPDLRSAFCSPRKFALKKIFGTRSLGGPPFLDSRISF